MNIDPSKIYSVSIMPCTAKNSKPAVLRCATAATGCGFSINYPGNRQECFSPIDFFKLAPSQFDPWMGQYTGAGVIFGATGWVMEAALRTVYEVVTEQELKDVKTSRRFAVWKASKKQKWISKEQ